VGRHASFRPDEALSRPAISDHRGGRTLSPASPIVRYGRAQPELYGDRACLTQNQSLDWDELAEVEMKKAISLTLNEAGYVVGQSRATINRAIDRGVIKARLFRRGKTQVRRVGGAELRFLAITAQIGIDLTPAARRKIYEAIRRALPEAPRLEFGIMELKLTEVDRRIDERLRRLEQLKALVDESAPEPVLRGTGVPVHVVAALARGQNTAEIVDDYPTLTAGQVEAAAEYAKVYPRTGRPLPTRSLKRMLGDLAAAGVWDLENGPPPVEPQPIP
jgi:hypothetical protein